MSRRLLIIASVLLFSTCAAPAQTPSPDAMTAARSLVTTLKLADQYKALLPAILVTLKPVLTQDRPEIERDYDAMLPTIVDAFAPYYNAMVNDVATVYANNFTLDELISSPIMGGCLRPSNVSRKLTTSFPNVPRSVRWTVNKLLQC